MHRFNRFGFQALVSLAIGLAAVCGLAGCTNSTAKSQLSQTPLISLAITQTPPATVITGSSSQVSATVTNDPANAGVDWIATCGSTASCGSFSPSHTASAATTVFTAPTSVPSHTTATVMALSTTDHSKFSSFTVTVVSTVTGVTITQFPPATAPAGTTVTVSATVAGDPANLGVDWKASCGGIDCTPPGFHSLSGVPVNFVVPPVTQIPNIVGTTVTLTAYAAADHSYHASAALQVAPQIIVTITQMPPSTMVTNATATIIATVQNDPTNAGVIWSVSCATAPCGTVVPLQTASGAPTVFTAPAVVPGTIQNPNPAVVIVAQAAASQSASIQVGVTIVAPISVTLIQNVTNSTIVQGRSASLIATVTNDTSNLGVDWSCSPVGSCGSFSLTHTASGASTSYTAPSAIPAGGTVTITAASTFDSTKMATQTVTVTAAPPPNSLLTGQFVMLLNSQDSQNGAFVLGGIISGDGNGTIISTTFDVTDAAGNAGQGINAPGPSPYSIGSDGHGQIQLLINTTLLNRSFGVTGPASACGSTPKCGSLTLSVVFVTPQHATLSESDSFGTATGTLDLQNLQSFTGINPGVYSLGLSGSEVGRPTAGYFVASAVTIPSTTSYSYITDQSDGGVITNAPFTTVSQGFTSGGLSGSDLRLPNVNLGLPNQFNLDMWPIDSAHFVVTDTLDSFVGTPNVIVGGHFTLQPSTHSVSGTYAFTETGATSAAQPQVVGGILTCGSTGVLDVVPLSGSASANQAVNATCGAVTNGRSLITVTGATSPGISQFAAYPTTDQGLYLIELDGGAAGTSGSSGAGVALQQTLTPPIASAAFNGNYASNYTSTTVLGSQAFSGLVAADGTSALAGTGDVNSFNGTATPPVGTPSLGAGFSGSYTAGSNGRFPVTLTITPASGQPSPQITNPNLACYLVDANTCMLLGLDATAPGTGMLLLQNTGL